MWKQFYLQPEGLVFLFKQLLVFDCLLIVRLVDLVLLGVTRRSLWRLGSMCGFVPCQGIGSIDREDEA